MGSQVLKLLLTTWNFWLLSPSSSSELLPPSPAMATMAVGMVMEVTVEDMVATEDTTARGPLMLRLRLMPSPPPLPSPDMVTTVATWADITLTDTDMLLLTPTDITLTTARDLLMPSQPMVTTVMDMVTELMGMEVMATEATVEDTMVMVMVTATDTTVEKFQKFMLIQSD